MSSSSSCAYPKLSFYEREIRGGKATKHGGDVSIEDFRSWVIAERVEILARVQTKAYSRPSSSASPHALHGISLGYRTQTKIVGAEPG
jgi:hypothetical protein